MKVLNRELKHAVDGISIQTFAKGTPVDELPESTVAHAEKFEMLVEGKSVRGGDEDKSQSGGDEDKSQGGVKPSKKGK